jgi:hypothetical protein
MISIPAGPKAATGKAAVIAADEGPVETAGSDKARTVNAPTPESGTAGATKPVGSSTALRRECAREYQNENQYPNIDIVLLLGAP